MKNILFSRLSKILDVTLYFISDVSVFFCSAAEQRVCPCAHHFPLVAEAEGTDVLRLTRLVGPPRGGGVDVEEGRRGSVAGLAVVEAFAQEQHVPQVADVAAGQA